MVGKESVIKEIVSPSIRNVVTKRVFNEILYFLLLYLSKDRIDLVFDIVI